MSDTDPEVAEADEAPAPPHSTYRLLGADDQPTDVDATAAQEGLATGTLRTAQPLRLRHSSGAVYEVPPEQVASALASRRFVLDTPEEAERRQYARDHGDAAHVAVTGAASTLRGASLGGSELLEEGLGVRDEIDRLREANPTAAMGGEIGGALLTAIPSGGESVLGRAALAPGRLALGLGERAGASVARGLAPEGAGLVTRLAARTLGGVVEGGVQAGLTEGGHILTEEALGDDPNDVADRLIGAVGLGAFVGGAAHGGAGVLGEAGGGLVRGGRHTVDLFRRQFLAQTGSELQPGLASLAEAALRRGVPLAQVLSGDAEGVVPRLFGEGGERAREVLLGGARIRDEHIRALDEALTGAASARRALDSELHGAHKVRALAAVIDGGAGAEQLSASDALLTRMRSLSDQIDQSARLYGQGGEYGPQAGRIATRMRDATNAARERITNAVSGFERGTLSAEERSAEVFAAMDGMRREAGTIASRTRGVSAIENAFSDVRTQLENPELWGEAATTLQRETNEALHREINWGGDFDRLLMRDGAADSFDRVAMADSARVASHLSGSGSAANASAERIARDSMQATSDLSEAVLRNRGGAFSRRAVEAAEDLRTQQARLRQLYERATSDIQLQNQAAHLEGQGGLGALVVGGVGSALGGPVLGAAAAAGSALANPVRSARILGTIERLVRQADSGIAASVRSFLGRASAGATRAVRATGRAAYTGVQAYERRVRELSLHRDGTRLTGDLARTTGELSHAAPRVTAAVQTTAARATSYLQQAQPRGQELPGTLIAQRSALPPRPEMERFLRVARAVDDPSTVLDDLRNRSLTPEAVEAIRVVYPALYQRIVRTVSEELARDGAHPSYQDRIQLGTLLNVPTDPSLVPATIALLQAGQALGSQAEANRKPPSGGPAGADSLLSGMDRIEARRASA